MGVSNRMLVLWVSGLAWDVAHQVPAVRTLQAKGATVTALEPLPITGQQSQSLQVQSGQHPGYTGYFDSWTTRQYIVQSTTEHTSFVSSEIISVKGRTGTQVNLALAEVPDFLNTLEATGDYQIVRTSAGTDWFMLDQVITAAQKWCGLDGTCLLISDYHSAVVKSYVNLNDELRSIGMLETSEQDTICWQETLAYHVGHGQIWINLEGREAAGIVAPRDEYDQVCQVLMASLSARLLDPHTGEPVIEQIYRRGDLYTGDYLFQAPDLVVVLRPGYAPSPRSAVLDFDGMPIWSAPANTYTIAGLHPTEVAGLLIATGPAFAAGKTIERASLVDFVPTFFHALHLPISTRMDGQVITDLFTPAYMRQFPLQRAEEDSGLSTADEEEIMSRLKSLGYVG